MDGKRWLLLAVVCVLCAVSVAVFHLDVFDVVRASILDVYQDFALSQAPDNGDVPQQASVPEVESVPAASVEEPVPEAEEPEPVNVADVPILMYHAFVETREEVAGPAYLSAETFEAHLRALRDADYQTVSLSDLIDFVYEGEPLPEKPVVLVADDGYLDNLTVAAPLLEEYDACMTVAVIGCSVGDDTYKDTGEAMRPHFSLEQAQPWVDAGVIEIISHSYDMHQITSRDGSACRQGMYPLEGEEEAAYAQALRADIIRSVEQLEQGLGVEVEALAYPFGKFTWVSEEVLQELGFLVTLTIEPGTNKLVRGMPQSLYQMERNWITDDMTSQDLLVLLHSLRTE